MRFLIAIGLALVLGHLPWCCQSFAQGAADPPSLPSLSSEENAPKAQRVAGESGETHTGVPEINRRVLAALDLMPSGGGYAVHAGALRALQNAIVTKGKVLHLAYAKAVPSFCSGATYLVFLQVIQSLEREGKIDWSAELTDRLRVKAQADGVGVWGRWNANGPGTAKLFFDCDLGRNFSQLQEAQAGDFMKIFWTSSIGFQERGHSVIYLGVHGGDCPELEFWSSNQGMGYGRKRVPLSKIGRMIFTRLERPENLARMLQLPERDEYLAGLSKKGSSGEEMNRMIGLVP